MRVTMIRISTEKEIRRMEMKSRVEIWQEGGPRVTLGAEQAAAVPVEDGAAGVARTDPGQSVAPVNSRRASSSAGEGRRSFSDRRLSLLRRRSSVDRPELETPTATTTLTIPPISEEPPSPPPPPPPPTEESVAPLSLDATDVHILGQLTILPPANSGPSMTSFRTLVQSFSAPEISISYVLEVGLQPRKGAVREAFSHVWGGGLVEVVLGSR